MAKSKPKVGLIAEADSDVSTIRIFIHRISKDKKIGTEKFTGDGCGKITKKCNSWAKVLKDKGCSLLLIIHDLDKKNLKKLKYEIEAALCPCAISSYIIVIPIQELEAWLLSDPENLKKSMSLKRIPKISTNTESIDSPKEHLGKIIFQSSDREKDYMNTKHNVKIAQTISIDIIKDKCPSFIPFYDFIKKYCI